MVSRNRHNPRAPTIPLQDDTWLTTRVVANRLGVSTSFVVAEIQDDRLHAFVLERPGLRRIYRIRPSWLSDYLHRFGWSHIRG